jgi:hypothetical protein
MPLSKPKSKPSTSKTQQVESPEKARELLSIVQDLQFEVMELQKKILPEIQSKVANSAQQTKEFITKIAREHFDARQERILADIYEFFCSEPVWETRFVHGVKQDKKEVENLYAQGYRYLCSTYDPDTKVSGTLYHRPVMPKTFEEFKSVYDRAKRAKENEPKALKTREEYYSKAAAKGKPEATGGKPAIKKLAKKS